MTEDDLEEYDQWQNTHQTLSTVKSYEGVFNLSSWRSVPRLGTGNSEWPVTLKARVANKNRKLLNFVTTSRCMDNCMPRRGTCVIARDETSVAHASAINIHEAEEHRGTFINFVVRLSFIHRQVRGNGWATVTTALTQIQARTHMTYSQARQRVSLAFL